MSGITPLLQTLKELERKNVKGEILTTNYLNFSEPKALMTLNSLNNIRLKMYDAQNNTVGFHTKGYIFKREEVYRIIIGSLYWFRFSRRIKRIWRYQKIIWSECESKG